MKLFYKAKDGGPESSVTGYWLIEHKGLFSICLLKFDGASREAFHTHAFDAISWVLSGGLTETLWKGPIRRYLPSFKPVITKREVCHKVDSDKGVTWVLTFRGPWTDKWIEHRPLENRMVTLTHGRQEIPA
jgi:hypothetical protein